MMMFQLNSAIAVPALVGEYADPITGLRLDVPKTRQKCVRLLVQQVLSTSAAGEAPDEKRHAKMT